MTTIACDGKSMAADGQRELSGTIVALDAEKIRVLDDGRIVGSCGIVSLCLRFANWLETVGAPKPDLKNEDGFVAMVLSPDGSVELYSEQCEPMPVQVPIAIGSGMDFAIAAMEAGKTPAESVAIAAKRDPHTGGKITAIHLVEQPLEYDGELEVLGLEVVA